MAKKRGKIERYGFNGGAKRTSSERYRDMMEIARLYLMGYTLNEMVKLLQEHTGADYTLSANTIRLEVDAVRKEWQKSALVDFNEAVNNAMAKIDALEHEYWQAWMRSQVPKQTITKKRTPIPARNEEDGSLAVDEDGALVYEEQNGEPRYIQVEESERFETSVGNSAFLDGVKWCIDRRIKLLGLDAPQKIRFENDYEEETDKRSDPEMDNRRAAILLQVLQPGDEKSLTAVK